MALRQINGRWHVAIRYRDEKGQEQRFRRTIGRRRSKKEAHEIHDRIVEELRTGNRSNLLFLADGEEEASYPFSGFAKLWFDKYVVANNKPSEISTKKTIIRRHLVPFFGDDDIRGISAEDIEQFKTEKIKEVGPKTVNNFLTVLRTMLNYAIKWDYLDKSPMSKVSPLKTPDDEFDFYDKEETARFLEYAEPKFFVFFFALFRTGMREGELFGLRWRDVDFKNGIILVRQNYVKKHFGTPKSGKSRSIPMTPQLRELLASYPKNPNSELIFCQDDGTPWNRDIVKRPFWRAIEKAGLKTIDIHEMRDSFASQLVMGGKSLKEVQELLGHSDIRMTMKYAHLSPGYLKETVLCLDMPEKAEEKREDRSESGQVLAKATEIDEPAGAKILIFHRK